MLDARGNTTDCISCMSQVVKGQFFWNNHCLQVSTRHWFPPVYAIVLSFTLCNDIIYMYMKEAKITGLMPRSPHASAENVWWVELHFLSQRCVLHRCNEALIALRKQFMREISIAICRVALPSSSQRCPLTPKTSAANPKCGGLLRYPGIAVKPFFFSIGDG